MIFLLLKKAKMLKTRIFLALKLSYVVFILEKTIKGIYSCPLEIIKGLTDKGQFAKVLTLKAPRKNGSEKCRLLKSSAANNCLTLLTN